MKMTILERFKQLSFLNKLGVVSAAVTIVGFFLGIVFYFFPLSTDNSAKVARVAAITSLNSDLEKLKVILPVNQALSDCMKKRKGTIENLLEVCAKERKLNGEDPQQIIEKHRASLQLHFSSQELEQIDEGLKSIRFSAYEMWNNQLSLEGWKSKGCPSYITVLNTEEARKYMKEPGIKSGCAVPIEKYDSFLERDAKNENLITSTRKAVISVDNLNFLVVAGHVEPGVKTTIEDLFYRKNNEMYGDMLADIKTMTPLLKKLIEE